MPTYAQEADCESYTDGMVVTDAPGLAALIERAERDVDWAVGPLGTLSNGLKFGDPSGANERRLSPAQVEALRRATCAQVEYRLRMGPAFFSKAQHDSVGGPDFSTQGKLPRLGPQAAVELEGHGLVVTSAFPDPAPRRGGFPVLPLEP